MKITDEWTPLETGRHQDHVIAHVVGATVLGYFEIDQAAHFLLDIGFLWTIFVDGEMGLLSQSYAIKELGLGAEAEAELLADVQLLHDEGRDAAGLKRMTPAPVDCLIAEVSFYGADDRRRLLIRGEQGSLAVETSLETSEVRVEPVSEG